VFWLMAIGYWPLGNSKTKNKSKSLNFF